jgi:hypothetical protein
MSRNWSGEYRHNLRPGVVVDAPPGSADATCAGFADRSSPSPAHKRRDGRASSSRSIVMATALVRSHTGGHVGLHPHAHIPARTLSVIAQSKGSATSTKSEAESTLVAASAPSRLAVN